jgi:hypothetical protein
MHHHLFFARNGGLLGPVIIFALAYAIYSRQIPGINPINATIFIVAGFLFIPSYIQAPRTYALSDLRRYGVSELYVFSKEFSDNRTGSNFTWAGINNKCYRIAFSGSEQGARNGEAVLRIMKSTPGIIWLQPGVWLVFYSVILLLNILLHDSAASLFSGMVTDEFREIAFYLPSILSLICPALSYIFVIVRDNILYKCAVTLASEIEAELIAKAGSPMKCYHNICPNCGANTNAYLKNCISCGASLEVMESDSNLSSIRFMRDENPD